MKKIEIAKEIDFKATCIFITAAVAFTVNSLLNNMTRAFDMPSVAETISLVFVIAFSIFGYVMTVKGFSSVNKACRLCEKNENYYMGKNLLIFSVVCIILSVILSIVALVFSLFLSQYNAAEGLTSSDVQARNNLLVLIALVNIVMQFFSISTVYIFYLWRIHKVTPKSEKISTFALLAMLIMTVHLVIGILNAVYTVKDGSNTFLPGFSSVLNTVKYVVLLLFFMVRRTKLVASVPDEEIK